MNARKSLVSIPIFVCVLLLACTPTAGQPYGSPATSLTDCFTAEPTITSVDSGFCEGISLGTNPLGRGSETTIAFVPAWTGAGGFHEAGLVIGFNGSGGTGLLNWAISTDQGRT